MDQFNRCICILITGQTPFCFLNKSMDMYLVMLSLTFSVNIMSIFDSSGAFKHFWIWMLH